MTLSRKELEHMLKMPEKKKRSVQPRKPPGPYPKRTVVEDPLVVTTKQLTQTIYDLMKVVGDNCLSDTSALESSLDELASEFGELKMQTVDLSKEVNSLKDAVQKLTGAIDENTRGLQ